MKRYVIKRVKDGKYYHLYGARVWVDDIYDATIFKADESTSPCDDGEGEVDVEVEIKEKEGKG